MPPLWFKISKSETSPMKSSTSFLIEFLTFNIKIWTSKALILSLCVFSNTLASSSLCLFKLSYTLVFSKLAILCFLILNYWKAAKTKQNKITNPPKYKTKVEMSSLYMLKFDKGSVLQELHILNLISIILYFIVNIFFWFWHLFLSVLQVFKVTY